MKLIDDLIIAKNTGKALTVKSGHNIRVIGESYADFVAFNLDNLRERFDQGRTKMNAGKIFISNGDKLVSKFNRVMLTIIEDTYKEGTHDLEAGMCSGAVYRTLYELGRYPEMISSKKEHLPDHGCWENLSEALKPWKIEPEDIPSPFNIFMTMELDSRTGVIHFSSVRPRPGTYMELRAEMNCLIAISACPDANKGKDLRVQVFE